MSSKKPWNLNMFVVMLTWLRCLLIICQVLLCYKTLHYFTLDSTFTSVINSLDWPFSGCECTATQSFLSKPWTQEKISGMFIVSRPIRSEMKPQKITAKPQHGLVTTWFETTSWVFLPRQIFNFTIFKYLNSSLCISAYLCAKNRYEWYV